RTRLRLEAARGGKTRKACPFWSYVPPSTDHRGGALDRLQNADVRPAAAFQPLERLLDLGVVGLFLFCEEGRGRHDPAIDAVAALRHLLLNVRGLQRMRLLRRAEPGE